MRVKLDPQKYGIEKFEFGKTYYIAYAGTSYGEVFVFTRKNSFEMCDIVDGKKVSSHRMSRRSLKRIMKLGGVYFIAEVPTKKKMIDEI